MTDLLFSSTYIAAMTSRENHVLHEPCLKEFMTAYLFQTAREKSCNYLLKSLSQLAESENSRNALCLSSQIFNKHCFLFILGLTIVPRENKNNAYSKCGGGGGEGKKRVSWHFPLRPIKQKQRTHTERILGPNQLTIAANDE